MFFGAGGIFFNKLLAKYNICNDIDDDIFNLYWCLQNKKEELIKEIELMPISESLLNFWKTKKETEPIRKSIRFLMLSNLTYSGAGSSIRCAMQNDKSSILSNIERSLKHMSLCKFLCKDFRNVIKSIGFKSKKEKEKSFIYADPPYLGTKGNYKGFTETDTKDLFEVLVRSEIRFAISEFNNDLVLDLATHYKLNVINIGERQNLKNKRTEILITNYQNRQMQLFDFQDNRQLLCE